MHIRLTLLHTVSLCLGNKRASSCHQGLLYTHKLHLPHMHGNVCASRIHWPRCTCADQLKIKLSISWAYWIHCVCDLHSKSRASGRSQSAAHAEISNMCVVCIYWLCWKFTSYFPTWKALEVTATPEPVSQARKTKQTKKAPQHNSNKSPTTTTNQPNKQKTPNQTKKTTKNEKK